MGRCDGLGWDIGLGLVVSGERNRGRCLGGGVRVEGVEEERKKNEKGEEYWWLGSVRWVGGRGGSELGRRDQRGGGREKNSREEWRSESVRREDQLEEMRRKK